MQDNLANWVEKYRARSFSDIKGQSEAIVELKNFIFSFPDAKKSILLHGPAGVGKTSLAHIVKKEFGLEIFELNASDLRNREQLHAKLKPALEQQSLFNKSKVILIDEVDGLSASEQGGISELISLIENAKFPIIITANDIWEQKFSELRNKCKLISLKEIDYRSISLILQEIARKENLHIDNQVLISIAVRSKGDVRAAINDLQALSHEEDYFSNYMAIDERNKATDIFGALKFVFKNMLNDETLKIYESVDLPLEKIFLWIEENIPNEYSGEELYKAYEALSIADVFRGRIRRQRYWRLLVYQNIFLSAGISLAKTKPKIGYTHYQKPTRILKMWMSNNANKHKKTIIAKYAAVVHCSKKKAAKEFPFIKSSLKNGRIQKELRLDEQEVEYIMKLA